MNKKKVIFSILKEIDKGNRPKQSDYNISEESFGEIVDLMIQKEFISNASVVRGGQGNKVKMVFLNNSKIAFSGIEYLEDNSLWIKTYKGLEKAKEWIRE